jgi:hypothetical protein
LQNRFWPFYSTSPSLFLIGHLLIRAMSVMEKISA